MSRCARLWRSMEPTGKSAPGSTPHSPVSGTCTNQVRSPSGRDCPQLVSHFPSSFRCRPARKRMGYGYQSQFGGRDVCEMWKWAGLELSTAEDGSVLGNYCPDVGILDVQGRLGSFPLRHSEVALCAELLLLLSWLFLCTNTITEIRL